jgi:sigma-E factor negative regulatory protein RseA
VSAWHQQRLPEYLRQHAQQVGMGAADGALPYARAASMQGN